MQASLSNNASGKSFRTKSFTAVLPCFSAENQFINDRLVVGLDTDNHKSATLAEGAGLAHDAGNLLGALSLYCDLLALPGVLQPKHRHYAEDLQQLSARSQLLIEKLLDPVTISRHAARSRATDERERVVLPDVIESNRGIINAVAQRTVAVAYQAGATLPVAVPKESLERILVNLTKNAAEALKGKDPKGRAAISLRVSCDRNRSAQERIVLTVEDKGCGMNAETIKVLMGEEQTKIRPVVPGHGMGFQVVRELVKASAGQLCLTSRTDSGTTVSIAWAVARQANESHRAEDSIAPAQIPNALEERRRLMGIACSGHIGRVSC